VCLRRWEFTAAAGQAGSYRNLFKEAHLLARASPPPSLAQAEILDGGSARRRAPPVADVAAL
jgi:hypothetical protein